MARTYFLASDPVTPVIEFVIFFDSPLEVSVLSVHFFYTSRFLETSVGFSRGT